MAPTSSTWGLTCHRCLAQQTADTADTADPHSCNPSAVLHTRQGQHTNVLTRHPYLELHVQSKSIAESIASHNAPIICLSSGVCALFAVVCTVWCRACLHTWSPFNGHTCPCCHAVLVLLLCCFVADNCCQERAGAQDTAGHC